MSPTHRAAEAFFAYVCAVPELWRARLAFLTATAEERAYALDCWRLALADDPEAARLYAAWQNARKPLAKTSAPVVRWRVA